MPDPEPKPEPQPVPIDLSKIDWKGWATPLAVIAVGAMLFFQQVKVNPTPGPGPAPKPVVIEPTKFDPTDTIATLNKLRLDAEKTKLLCEVVNQGDGSFVLVYQPVGKEPVYRTVTVSGGVVPVPPVPPGPVPPVPPPVPPTPNGPLTILLVRESKDSTPEMAALIRDLRNGEPASYLKSKNHSLGILDVDAKDKDGKPAPEVEQWRPQFSGLTLPALVVYDMTTKQLVHKQAIPSGATAASVITAIKEHGG